MRLRMKLEMVTNKVLIEVEKESKVLIEVEKQLESMRSTYRRLHRYEKPVGNPIEKNIKNICSQLAKFNKICSKRNYDSSKGAGPKDRARKIERTEGGR